MLHGDRPRSLSRRSGVSSFQTCATLATWRWRGAILLHSCIFLHLHVVVPLCLSQRHESHPIHSETATLLCPFLFRHGACDQLAVADALDDIEIETPLQRVVPQLDTGWPSTNNGPHNERQRRPRQKENRNFTTSAHVKRHACSTAASSM